MSIHWVPAYGEHQLPFMRGQSRAAWRVRLLPEVQRRAAGLFSRLPAADGDGELLGLVWYVWSVHYLAKSEADASISRPFADVPRGEFGALEPNAEDRFWTGLSACGAMGACVHRGACTTSMSLERHPRGSRVRHRRSRRCTNSRDPAAKPRWPRLALIAVTARRRAQHSEMPLVLVRNRSESSSQHRNSLDGAWSRRPPAINARLHPSNSTRAAPLRLQPVSDTQ